MRKLILGLAVSLDSFIEGPAGEYDWCFTDQDYGLSDFFKRIDAVFMGRKSYEMSRGMEADMGMPRMKTYVFSNSLSPIADGEIVGGDIKTKIDAIKAEPGKDIWLFGGASLTSALMNHKLVDELWLSVHPILLGSGTPLFNGITGRIPLHLMDTKTYSSGLVSLKYRIAEAQ
jgi:dihydrofolate reductase